MSTDNFTPVENRSEILFVYDGLDCNPNGNPLSGADEPRIDTQTQQAIITDVRLKRYLRDQMDDDGHGVFIRNVKDDEGHAPTREALLKATVDIESPDDVTDDVFDEFLANAVDARMFGATLSISAPGNGDEGADSLAAAIAERIPAHLTGPIQFSPGRSLNAVEINEEYNSLTSVIGTGEGKREGGFDLDDNRIKYGIFTFYGRVDENGAENTNLQPTDVERLDTLCWRAIRNQTTSRSKMGQEPRFYLRVEYDGGGFHIGDLQGALSIDTDHSKPDAEMRNIRDVTLDITEVVDALHQHAERIDTVHTTASDALSVSYNGEQYDGSSVYGVLNEAVGPDKVNVIDVYDEYEATLPDGNTDGDEDTFPL